jgi:hypothetical protein
MLKAAAVAAPLPKPGMGVGSRNGACDALGVTERPDVGETLGVMEKLPCENTTAHAAAAARARSAYAMTAAELRRVGWLWCKRVYTFVGRKKVGGASGKRRSAGTTKLAKHPAKQ